MITEIIDASTLTGTWEVPIPQEIPRMQEHPEDSALTIQLRISYIWKPCEVMESSDERSLGVDILLSEINLPGQPGSYRSYILKFIASLGSMTSMTPSTATATGMSFSVMITVRGIIRLKNSF